MNNTSWKPILQEYEQLENVASNILFKIESRFNQPKSIETLITIRSFLYRLNKQNVILAYFTLLFFVMSILSTETYFRVLLNQNPVFTPSSISNTTSISELVINIILIIIWSGTVIFSYWRFIEFVADTRWLISYRGIALFFVIFPISCLVYLYGEQVVHWLTFLIFVPTLILCLYLIGRCIEILFIGSRHILRPLAQIQVEDHTRLRSHKFNSFDDTQTSWILSDIAISKLKFWQHLSEEKREANKNSLGIYFIGGYIGILGLTVDIVVGLSPFNKAIVSIYSWLEETLNYVMASNNLLDNFSFGLLLSFIAFIPTLTLLIGWLKICALSTQNLIIESLKLLVYQKEIEIELSLVSTSDNSVDTDNLAQNNLVEPFFNNLTAQLRFVTYLLGVLVLTSILNLIKGNKE